MDTLLSAPDVCFFFIQRLGTVPMYSSTKFSRDLRQARRKQFSCLRQLHEFSFPSVTDNGIISYGHKQWKAWHGAARNGTAQNQESKVQ